MPFCSNCGKEHSNDAKFCTSCGKALTKQAPNQQQYQYFQPQHFANPQQTFTQQPSLLNQEEVTVTYGLGKAIAGGVLATVGIILALCALILSVSSQYYNYYTGYYEIDVGCVAAAIVLSIAATPLSILSVIFSGTSIRNFNYAKENYHKYPVPTLVLGINFLVVGILSCFFSFSAFFGSLALL